MSARFVIGIDLGTTSSVVSFVDLQEATPVSRVFSLLQEQTSGVTVESQLLPSLLHLPPEGGAEKVGLIAREQLAYTPCLLYTSPSPRD